MFGGKTYGSDLTSLDRYFFTSPWWPEPVGERRTMEMHGARSDPEFGFLTLLIGSSYMKWWPSLLSVLLFAILSTVPVPDAQAQTDSGHQNVTNETRVTDDLHGGHASERWEASSEGKAFSEFAHHFAGSLEVIFGLAELGAAIQYPLPYWTRFILPGALSMVGGFTLIWSDRDAWPIGSLSFVATFFGDDREMIEHKVYGILTFAVAFFETLRRLGWVRHPAWAAPLVLLVLAGGLSLFVHSHGNHPEAAKIQFQHSLLGIVDVGAAFSKGLASWLPGASSQMRNRWDMAWGGSIILSGLLLLAYSE
ncbi:MAG: hypothetical protein AB7F94_08755 [Nitrospira sp.]